MATTHSVYGQSNAVTLGGGELVNNRTLVPLRAIFEELDAEVEWIQKTQTVIATKNNTKISLKIGSTTAQLNGKNIKLDVALIISEERTLVPLRFVSESLGAKVEWNNDRAVATITLGSKIITVETDVIFKSKWKYTLRIPTTLYRSVYIDESDRNTSTFYELAENTRDFSHEMNRLRTRCVF